MSAVSNMLEGVAPDRPRFEVIRRILFGRGSTIFAVVLVVIFAFIAIFAPLIAPYDPILQSISTINRKPTWEHWLGTDQFGRDVLSRLIYGSRNSLLFGILAPTFAATVGTTLGVIAGYFGGIVDRVISRLIDTLLAFPELLLAIIIAAALGGGFWNIVVVLAFAFVPGFARVARATTLAVKQEPFIEACHAIGLQAPVIIFRHVIPNIAAPIVALMTLWVASAIRLEASLSFLGLGTQPPKPSWGNIIRDGLNILFGSPWSVIGAGFSITLVVLAFNLFGDPERDVLDPQTAP
jgi:peptide/nickel transport system permease protein